MTNRTAAIVATQMAAANLQAACKWMPAENFFANMVGHIGIVFGPDMAAKVVTIFEIARQEQEEMIDGMIRDPVKAGETFRQGIENWQKKRKQ